MGLHGHWNAGSEESALEAGVIDSLNGGHWRPPDDFADAYNWAFEDARQPANDSAAIEPNAIAPHQLGILGIIHVAVFADSDVDPREVAWIYEEARSHPVFADLSFNAFRAACIQVLQSMRRDTLADAFEAWTAAAAPSHAHQALELAMGAIIADGRVAEIEKGVALRLIDKLALPRDEALAILENAAQRRRSSAA